MSKDRIAVLHDGIGQGQVKVPELDDKILGDFGQGKGIRIKFKETGYESILERRHVRQGYKVTSKIASNQKMYLLTKGA
ncbi:MAG: hypothetical protein HDR04_13420 [Lachnospiraceae bacterium]|nr:hypothetical protein [Lachnospiraceae bacterium]